MAHAYDFTVYGMPAREPPAAPQRGNWTLERVALMRKLWLEGLSASQIARELTGVTRNAVIGKVHRIGLAARNMPSRPEYYPKPPRQTRSRISVAPRFNPTPAKPLTLELHEIAALPPANPALSVMALEHTHCRFPIGDPQAHDFAFCGRGRVIGKPYCADHCRLTYTPTTGRRDKGLKRLAEWVG